MSQLRQLVKRIKGIEKRLPRLVVDAAMPVVIDVLKAEYPPEHVRTGRAKDSIEGKPMGAKFRLRAGVRKKKSKSGKRRKSRTGKVNYGQFLPWLLKDDEAIERAIDSVMEGIDVL